MSQPITHVHRDNHDHHDLCCRRRGRIVCLLDWLQHHLLFGAAESVCQAHQRSLDAIYIVEVYWNAQ